MKQLKTLCLSALIAMATFATTSVHAQVEPYEPPAEQTQTDGNAGSEEQSSNLEYFNDYIDDYVDEETWAVLHGSLHAILNELFGTQFSIWFSLQWEEFEHEILLQGLEPYEAWDDIFFWDRLGDLPIPLEYRLELIQYLAEALNGQGPFTMLANLQEYLEQLQAAYELYMMAEEAVENAGESIDESIDNIIQSIEETIDELFGSEDETPPVEDAGEGSGN